MENNVMKEYKKLYIQLVEMEYMIRKEKEHHPFYQTLYQYLETTLLTLILVKTEKLNHGITDDSVKQKLRQIADAIRAIDSILFYQNYIDFPEKENKSSLIAHDFSNDIFSFITKQNILRLMHPFDYFDFFQELENKVLNYDDVCYLLSVTGSFYPYLKQEFQKEKEKTSFPSSMKLGFGLEHLQKAGKEYLLLQNVNNINSYCKRLLQLRSQLDESLMCSTNRYTFYDQISESSYEKKKELLKTQGIWIH